MFIDIQEFIVWFSIEIVADFRSKVTSKKSVTMKLHSLVMLNPLLLKVVNNVFFILSASGPDMFSKKLKPSSLYMMIFCLPNSLLRRSTRYKPSNSHNSAPS